MTHQVADPDLPPMRELMQFAHDGNECYEVARNLVGEYPNLIYVEGRYYRALSDGTGKPDLPGHAWVITPSCTIIDAAFTQFDPLAGTRHHCEPVRIVTSDDVKTQERYLPDGSTRLIELLQIGGQ